MPSLTSYQQKQYKQTIEQLKADNSANIQIVLVPAMAGFDKGVEDQSQIFPPPTPGQAMGITIAICLQYPVSRGTVHIKSSDPKEHPAVDPAFLDHPADAAILAAGGMCSAEQCSRESRDIR